MAHEFDAVEGDTGTVRRYTLYNKDGGVIDLTGVTSVTLKWVDNAGTLVERAMDILSPPTDGQAQYQFLADDLEKGVFHLTQKIVDAAGKITHSLDYDVMRVRAKQV